MAGASCSDEGGAERAKAKPRMNVSSTNAQEGWGFVSVWSMLRICHVLRDCGSHSWQPLFILVSWSAGVTQDSVVGLFDVFVLTIQDSRSLVWQLY